MVYGVHPVLEALEAGREIERIIVREGLGGDMVPRILQMGRQRGVPIQPVPQGWFARLGGRNHQGIVAYIAPITYQPIETLIPMLYEAGKEPLVIVADGITDVRNLGAIVRTAECSGAHALVVPKRGSAQISSDTIKASAGALSHFAVARVESLVACCRFLQDSGLRIVVASERGARYYHGANLTGPVALVLGDEAKGVSPKIAALADESVKIPIHGQVQSLNVSVAAGVILYEIERQRALQK